MHNAFKSQICPLKDYLVIWVRLGIHLKKVAWNLSFISLVLHKVVALNTCINTKVVHIHIHNQTHTTAFEFIIKESPLPL